MLREEITQPEAHSRIQLFINIKSHENTAKNKHILQPMLLIPKNMK